MKTDNELIAEFMGYVLGSLYGQRGAFEQPSGKFVGLATLQLFQTSWDWLMPVVEKIEVTTEAREEVGNLLSGWSHWYNQFNGTVNTDIRVAYRIVVEFIKWYNTQPK